MRNKGIKLLLVINLICTFLLSGCWNYKEVDQLAIVAGVAIDKDGKDKVLVTTEIMSIEQAGKQSSLKPVYIEAVGKTFFDAARAMIGLEGERLYWSHTKLVIISEDIAKDGISKVLDFINRDAELREDMWVLISREKTAAEIFNAKPQLKEILSFELDNTIRAQKSIARYPSVELYKFLDRIAIKETSVTLPTVKVIQYGGNLVSYVTGAAIIKADKLIGYLGETETRSTLWIQNELKGGLYTVQHVGGTTENVALEIFRSKTKVSPAIKDGMPIIKINVTIDVNIGEISGQTDFISKKGRSVLQRDAQKQIKKDLENVIEKAQKEYKSDFFGFGEKVKQRMPGTWKSIEKQWGKIFTDIETEVAVEVRIKGSATTRAPIKVEE